MAVDSSGSLIKETKGVVHGATFRFELDPPADHVCPEPVVVALIPARERAVIRSQRTLLQVVTFRKDPRVASLRKRQGAIDAVISTTVARVQPVGDNERRRNWVHHPYDMMEPFDLLPDIPRELAADRRYLEKLLYYTLFVYKILMDKNGRGPILFNHHAKEFFTKGYHLERMLATLEKLPDARFEMCQQIYEQYYHGSHYYILALLSGEALDANNHYYMYFCNARYFMARLDWDGQLLEQPLGKKLPTRDAMLYYAMRDPTVVRQYSTNPDYAKQLMAVLRAFQPDMRTAHIVAKVRRDVRAKAVADTTPAQAAAAGQPRKHFRAARMKKPPK